MDQPGCNDKAFKTNCDDSVAFDELKSLMKETLCPQPPASVKPSMPGPQIRRLQVALSCSLAAVETNYISCFARLPRRSWMHTAHVSTDPTRHDCFKQRGFAVSSSVPRTSLSFVLRTWTSRWRKKMSSSAVTPTVPLTTVYTPPSTCTEANYIRFFKHHQGYSFGPRTFNRDCILPNTLYNEPYRSIRVRMRISQRVT